ncbi:type IV-A pilus assembly ATPase PilB [Francisella tularensis]|uniref:Type IV-A pilus assembly ATPase PilB n=4 Tax=Francisella tularensis TaxID=263 RepID=A0A6B0K943_FRATU|nr:type IV-A pilus assembly ATPase PilB [Francisella tularensis]AFX70508.1 type II secretion system protein/type IV-A pilus assembly ATPase PilB [Francisella tularensis subsp. holarctica F92]ABU61353.1 type II secretion system protein/type IV-A pilus assembly ATPase PilB [Francisella tularensis subsp. holarctica FTNF002-00]AUP75243.1 type IV-A pilus assembly ATPase PilB [Francisella tularensis]MBC2779798.1 type IV-A pilus assembly ATPase PilB [Francisella tularensis subsp. holarctica]MBC278137
MIENPHICKKLASLLLHRKLITKQQLEEISHDKSLAKQDFLEYLIENEIVDNKSFMIESATLLRLQYIDLTTINVKFLPQEYFDIDFCRENHCLVLFTRKRTIHVAIANPIESQQILKKLRSRYDCAFIPVVAELNHLKEKIEEYEQYLKDEGQREDDAKLNERIDAGSELDIDFVEEGEREGDAIIGSGEDEEAPIIRFINNTIVDAIQKGASDIHFEPYEKNFRIRYRIDGLLIETFNTTKKNLAPKVISRLKIMSSLDIAEKRIPQDGKFKISLSREKAIDFRVSTCPISFGEKVVLRIIDSSSTQIPIEQLGFSESQKETYLKYIQQPQGMVLVTGPTGSGKTVTLYTGINILNKPEKNISTAEDPVELIVKGINQVSVNNKQGLTFAAALKSFLRQDPDIIMVGEIRDIETGSIAIKASQTGHLVMSTLHTNSAPETLNRLVDMGLPRYNIATSVTLIIAQRLIRKLCPKCKLPDTDTEFSLLVEDSGLNDEILAKTFGTTLDKVKNAKIYKANPKGCPRCFKGYKGRIGLYEVMPVSRQISRMILEDKNTMEIAIQAQKEGIATVRQSALVRVAEDLTSMEEVYRVS